MLYIYSNFYFMDYQNILKNLKPDHDFFIGIDSDGCVFDTMEVKQKDFFIPNAIKYFELDDISAILQETWEFVNLYSVYRGGNRFTSLIKVFEFLSERQEVKRSKIILPDLQSLKSWVKTETKLGNASLRNYFELNYDPDLEKVLMWTEAINTDIGNNLHSIPPFRYARPAIEKTSALADLIIISQTPIEALEREWEEQDLKKYVKAIAGQEHGTKTEHLALSAIGKYDNNRILMIGDARGDMDAARNNGVLFFPVIPGYEEQSWNRFLNEGIDKFINGLYSGSYQDSLLTSFKISLPESPPWIR